MQFLIFGHQGPVYLFCSCFFAWFLCVWHLFLVWHHNTTRRGKRVHNLTLMVGEEIIEHKEWQAVNHPLAWLLMLQKIDCSCTCTQQIVTIMCGTICGMSIEVVTSLASDLATSTDLILHAVYSVISEQIKPLQLVGQAAEFKFESKFEPLQEVWLSLPMAVTERNRKFRLQNQWPSSGGHAFVLPWRVERTAAGHDRLALGRITATLVILTWVLVSKRL